MLSGTAALDALGIVTVGPVVIAGRKDKGVCDRVELAVAVLHEIIRATVNGSRQITQMDHERQCSIPVDIGEHVLELRILLRMIIGEVTDERESKACLRLLGQSSLRARNDAGNGRRQRKNCT